MSRQGGFTLIELVVALAILAALTTVALRSVSGVQSQARYQQTTRTLDEIRSAIIGPANLRGSDGSALVTGFVADTGRLPNFLISGSDPLGANGDPLNELLQSNAMPAFRFFSSNTDPFVWIGVGWKGPYLRLGVGPSFIRDGWGNSFHCYDASASGIPLSAPGNAIAQVSSWSADNIADTNHGGTGDLNGYDADVSIPNSNSLANGGFVFNASFYGRVSMAAGSDGNGTSGPAPNQTLSGTGVSVWVCYFGPNLASTPNPVIDVPVQVTDMVNWQYALSNPNITVGPRVLKAYVVNASVNNVATFRTAITLPPNPAAGPVYFVSALNVTVTSGAQTAPNLVLPHYSP